MDSMLCRIGIFIAAGVCVTGAGAADDVVARSWAATCTGCHGTDGRSTGGIPVLAGMEKLAIVTAMEEFKSGARTATVMHQHARGYTDQQIGRIAAYFAAQRRD